MFTQNQMLRTSIIVMQSYWTVTSNYDEPNRCLGKHSV